MQSETTTHPRATRRPPAVALEPFETVLERHGPAVLRFCIARLGPDRGEDAFQETLLSALRHYEELRDAAAVGGWLFSIARRKIIDGARSRARAPLATAQLAEHGGAWHDPDLGGGDVWRLVAELPPKQSEAVALRYLGDLSHAAIGDAMGTTPEAARRNVFEGLKGLRRELGDER